MIGTGPTILLGFLFVFVAVLALGMLIAHAERERVRPVRDDEEVAGDE